MMAVLDKFQSDLLAEQERLMTENLEAANAFLEENKSKEGIKTLEGGIQYEVL